jgi:sialate O-acetylesterase
VSEHGYGIVYKLDIPNYPDFDAPSSSPGALSYDIDNSEDICDFTRIAYYMHLESVSFGSQWVWVSMDGFTNDATEIGVPTVASHAIFQEDVSNMNVFSNVDGIDGVAVGSTGNIEFWPHDYVPVPSGSDGVYDHSDAYIHYAASWGSMQVHVNSKTVFAFNRWNYADPADLGIGTNPGIGMCNWGTHPDWTFACNGGTYSVKNLEVWVK